MVEGMSSIEDGESDSESNNNSSDEDEGQEDEDQEDNESDESRNRDGVDLTGPNSISQGEIHASVDDVDEATAGTEDKLWYSGVHRKGRVFGRLLDLYIFANTYEIPRFKTAVMLEFQRFVASTDTLPYLTIVKHALDYLDLDSPMCQYLVICYGHYTNSEKVNMKRFATLSSTFLASVLLITFKRIDVNELVDDWCDFSWTWGRC